MTPAEIARVKVGDRVRYGYPPVEIRIDAIGKLGRAVGTDGTGSCWSVLLGANDCQRVVRRRVTKTTIGVLMR